MAQTTTRQPTHTEAVDIVLRCLTSECFHSCIAYWRGKYGDWFSGAVEKEALIKFKARRGSRK